MVMLAPTSSAMTRPNKKNSSSLVRRTVVKTWAKPMDRNQSRSVYSAMPVPPSTRMIATITITGASRRGRPGRPAPGVRTATLLTSVVRGPSLTGTQPQGRGVPVAPALRRCGVAAPLFAVVGEVEEHVAEAGWDQPPQLFALVD